MREVCPLPARFMPARIILCGGRGGGFRPASGSLFQLHYSDAVFSLAIPAQPEGFDGGMAFELLMNRLAQRAGAFAVDDGYNVELPHHGVVNEPLHL